jgi:hypothetical protein
MSYFHCEWIDKSVLEAQKSGKSRIKRFLEKGIYESQWSADDVFNPNFLKVSSYLRFLIFFKIDRIIDEGEIEEGHIYYLVKWCAQTYDLSTWEEEEVVNEVMVLVF